MGIIYVGYAGMKLAEGIPSFGLFHGFHNLPDDLKIDSLKHKTPLNTMELFLTICVDHIVADFLDPNGKNCLIK